MAHGNVDVLKLQTKGKAKLSERAGTVSLQADDPVCALQAIARQASIKILLTPDEQERIGKAGKRSISLTYAANLAGASEAAKRVFALVDDAPAGASPNKQFGVGKIIGFVGVLAVIAALVFVLAYKMLGRIYG